MAKPHDSVAEMQGLYGPFTMAERVVQKIWLQQDFSAASARLEDGRTLEVLAPGTWNLLGGPDFRGARLRVDGREVVGDIEVHFHASDWHAHGHRANPAYASVVLHVLLFPPTPDERPARNAAGVVIPALVLLPLLHRDLEDYAADDALETMTARDEWRRTAELANRPIADARALLRELALGRWGRKVHYARTRIERLGWEQAAHHTALEILGYRHNRVPMLAVAERWPLQEWRTPGPGLDEVMRSAGDNWQRHGVRPANHPATRLAQYRAWTVARPDWPERLRGWTEHLRAVGLARAMDASEGTAVFRRRCGMRALAEQLATAVAAACVGGHRWHTLVCDGLLPLAAAQSGLDLTACWFHWFPGDVPDQVRRALRQLQITGGPDQVHCHGFGQGLLAWFIRRDVAA